MADGQPHQDRSRRRRDALLRATVELLGESGARAVTHRAVAERAGVPLAATTYYFASVRELIVEALKLHATERVAELAAMTQVVASPGVSAAGVAEHLADLLVGRRPGVLVAQYQLYLEAARNPELQPAVAEALVGFEALAAAVLRGLGAREPEEAAGAFVALLDGFALHRLARPRPAGDETRILVAAMRALFLEQVMEPEVRDRLHERLRQPLGQG